MQEVRFAVSNQSHRYRFIAAALVATALPSAAMLAQSPQPGELVAAKLALRDKDYLRAKTLYRTYLAAHPQSVDAQLGIGESELGLHEYEAAELDYRAVVAAQPEMWVAHKDLVIVEAALGRWSEFDRERALLRSARQRGAPGIDMHESDVIDSFEVRGANGKAAERWIVREYAEPAGRSRTRYNFEHFSPEGRVLEYISLESASAAMSVKPDQGVRIGGDPAPQMPIQDFALNDYTTKSHGTIKRYPGDEPTYEAVRAEVIRWLRQRR